MKTNLQSLIPLSQNSISELNVITSFLNNRSYRTKDVPCNMLVSYAVRDDEEYYATTIAHFLAHTGNYHRYKTIACTENEISEWKESLPNKLGQRHACVIIGEAKINIEAVRNLCEQFKAFPEVIFCYCTHENNTAAIINEQGIGDFFQHQLEIEYPKNSFMCDRIMAELQTHNYRFTSSFSTALHEYCLSDYAIARNNSERDIKDICDRIIIRHNAQKRMQDAIDASAVPSPRPRTMRNIPLKPFPTEEALKRNETDGSSDRRDINILICSISLLYSKEPHYYYTSINNLTSGKNISFVFKGISQLEPGTKYIINKLALEGKRIDRIIPYCSCEAYSDVSGNKASRETSSLNFYINQIRDYMFDNENFVRRDSNEECYVAIPLPEKAVWKSDYESILKDASQDNGRELYFNTQHEWNLEYQINPENTDGNQYWIRPVKEDSAKTYDVKTRNLRVLNEFYNLVNEETKNGTVHIYLDAQGGQRSFFNMIFSLFSMFDSSKICIETVCATDYSYKNILNQVRDVTEEYQTIHLVSAINAFSHYGRGEMLDEYFKKNVSGTAVNEEQALISAIKQVSESISISDPSGFDRGLDMIENALTGFGDSKNSLLSLLADDIREKYEKLITSDERTPLETVRWCIKNKFTQQALAIIEDKMPTYILSRILKTQLLTDTSDECSARPIAGITHTGEDKKLLKKLTTYSFNSYTDSANMVLYDTFNKIVVDNADFSYRKAFIGELLHTYVNKYIEQSPVPLFSSSDDEELLKLILSKSQQKSGGKDLVPELVKLYLEDNSIDLHDFANQDEQVVFPQARKCSKSNYEKIKNNLWNTGTVCHINRSFIPQNGSQPAVFTSIINAGIHKDIQVFYKKFYKYLFGITVDNTMIEVDTNFKKAFAKANFLINWIRSNIAVSNDIQERQTAIDLLLESFTDVVANLTKNPQDKLSEEAASFAIAYSNVFHINRSNQTYGTKGELALDILNRLLQKAAELDQDKGLPPEQCLDQIISTSVDRHHYYADTAYAEYNSLIQNNCTDLDFITKYCAFREHENLRESGEGTFTPNKWDPCILNECRGRISARHSLHNYTTIIGLDGYIAGNRCILKMPINDMLIEVSYCYQDRDKLDLYLRLQQALKKERNNSSHASNSDLRLPLPIIENAIRQYIILSDELTAHADATFFV